MKMMYCSIYLYPLFLSAMFSGFQHIGLTQIWFNLFLTTFFHFVFDVSMNFIFFFNFQLQLYIAGVLYCWYAFEFIY